MTASETFWPDLCDVLATAGDLNDLGSGLSRLTDGAPLALEKRQGDRWQSAWAPAPHAGKSVVMLDGWGRLRTSLAGKRVLTPVAGLIAKAAARLDRQAGAPAGSNLRSSRHLAAADLHSEQQQTLIDVLMNTAPAAIAMTDINGHLVLHNQRFLTLFGFEGNPPARMEMGRLRRFFAENRRYADWLHQLPDAPGKSVEIDLRQVEPEARHLNLRSSPAHTADGRPTGHLFVFRDMTQQANVDKMKTELINVVSHELRTPLTSVLGFAELVLIRDLPTDKVRQYVGTIYTEGKRLSALLDDFLDINRLESRQQPYHMRQVQLAPIIRKVAAIFASDERHPIEIDIPPQLPPLRADADRLVQALTNLVSNAVKYSPNGGPVRIRTALQADQQRLVIRVQDQGLGIPETAIGHLFSKFFRVHRPGHEGIGGTGLGLAIVHEIIRAHGGDVWVESVEGEGSTFSFTLPVRVRPPRPAVPAENAAV
jgi:signal transduction histidine kinase